MSGIYISGMEMPNINDYNGISCCLYKTLGGQLRLRNNETGEFFDVIPVPDHGRLIEKSALNDACYTHFEDFMNGNINGKTALLNIEREIKAAPTVIQADVRPQPFVNDYAGLKVKYVVRKVSNGELVDDCFVLRPDKDKAAIAALEAYADATENQVLAADIHRWLSDISIKEES